MLLMRDDGLRNRQKADFETVRDLLGASGASARAAKIILDVL